MKRKLLFAALCVVSVLGLRAQTDVTSTYLTNADFSSSNGTTVEGWTWEKSDSFKEGGAGSIGWTVKNYASKTDDKHLSTEYCLGVEFRWGGWSAYNQETNSNLNVGYYELTFDVQNTNTSTESGSYENMCFVQVGGNKYSDSKSEWMAAGGSPNWTTHTISFSVTEAAKATISLGAGAGSTNKGDAKTPVLYFSHLKLTYYPFANNTDYSNLNTAINTVEDKAWGFDAGEYAPYNYVEVIQALAAAKAIDQGANNTQATVQALTATLNTTMTANAAEINAVFDGSFEYDYSGQAGNVNPIGWQRVKDAAADGYNVRYMNGSNPGLAATTSGKALFTKQSAYYGYATGYTMPLNADTYYTISFIYGGWGDCKNDGYVSMAAPNGTAVSLTTKDLPVAEVAADTKTDAWYNYTSIFKTGDAGNYVLGLRKTSYDTSGQSQYVYGDFVLKATTIAEATAYYNTVKDEVDDSYDAGANGGNEKTAFKAALDASVPATVSEIMEAAANFYTLRDAFVAATPKYDAYLAEKANAERIDASITASVSAPTTAAEADDALKNILVNEYNYVKDNFNADAATTYGITIDQWVGTATSGGNSDSPQTNSNEKWGETATTYYEQGKNGWGSTAWTLNYTKTVTLPANTYVLKVAARASQGTTATLKATIGGTTYTEALPNASAEGKGITTSGVASFSDGEFAKDGKGYGWQWRYLAFTLEAEGEVTLQIDASANSVNQWCSFGDVAVVSNVTTDALVTAYNNFVMPTLGFEDGQYAPYNNVEVLSAYAEAKAIVEGTKEPSTQPAVDALTDALTSPVWTANSGDVDAIFNGSFSSDVEGDWGLTGWTRTNAWGQQQTGLTGDYATAYYNQPGSLQYGNQGVYTMPLKASQLYKLTFAYRAHENNSNTGVTVFVKNGDEGLASVTFPANGSTSDWKAVEAYFTTGAAGNYVLTLGNGGNTWMTGVSLVKADEADLNLAANPTNYTYYQNVSLDRTFSTANYSTLVLPFAMTADETTAAFDEAYTLDGVEGESLKFKAADAIAAGIPYLVKAKAATLSVANKAIDPATTVTNTVVDNVTFVGTFAGETLTSANRNAWVVSNNNLYNVDSNVTVGAYRGYFTVDAGTPVKGLNIDLEGADGIGALRNAENETMGNAIFNLAGQRINKLQKGVNIINGKKVLVK